MHFVYVDIVNTKIKDKCYVCQYSWYWCLWLLHNTVYRVMRCRWEQSCILHTLTKTACLYKLWPKKCSSMNSTCEVVLASVQSLTKLAHMSKQNSQFRGFSIKCYDANCPQFPLVQLLIFGCNFVCQGVKLLVSLLIDKLTYRDGHDNNR